MAKPVLNPAGVQAVTSELYALPQTELDAQADLIRLDIRAWLADTFDCTPDQLAFLAGWDSAYAEALGDQASQAVSHRWPVLFVPEAPENTVRGIKWIKSEGRSEAQSGAARTEAGFSGLLTITTGY